MLFALATTAAFAQRHTAQPFSNPADWQYVASEHFDVFFSRDQEASAQTVARFAELSRYEIGSLFDYKPEERFTLVYAANAFELVHTNFTPNFIRERKSGYFELPRREAVVVDPGNRKGLYQEVKKQVATLILSEFSHNNRLSSVMQSHLLLHNPQWFVEGLAAYIASGWTFEDEMWIQSIRKEDILDLALEGDTHLNEVVRKSIWHYIVYEYGEQKISEIIYLVNIAHSVESGIISVLGITLNTLTDRWREFVIARASRQAEGRMEISQLPELHDVPLRSPDERITAYAYHPATAMLAVYLEKDGQHRLWFYNKDTETYQPTGLSFGVGSIIAERLRFEAPLAWSPDGKTLAAVAYKHPRLQLVYVDVESKKTTALPLGSEVQRINSMSWSHDGARLVFSALVNGQVDLYTTASMEAELEALTQDIYDELDPSWSLNDQFIFFSSNRQTEQADELPHSFERDYDLFALEHAVNETRQLTQTPAVNERFPYPVDDVRLNYLSDESGIANLYSLHIFDKNSSPVSNLSQSIESLAATADFLTFASPIWGKLQLFIIPNERMKAARPPSKTLLRLDYNTAYQRKLEERQLANQYAEQEEPARPAETTPAQEKEQPPKAEEEEKEKPPVRYYLFDEGTEPYEVRKPEKDAFERLPEPVSVNNSVFADEPKPLYEDIAVEGSQRAATRWAADYLALNIDYDPVARYGLNLGMGLSDLLNHHRLEVEINPYFNLKNGDARLRYTYMRHRIDAYAEAGFAFRHFRRENFLGGGDSLIFRYNRTYLKAGARYPLTAYLSVGLEGQYHLLERKDLKIIRPVLLNDNDQAVSAHAYALFDNSRQQEGYYYKGMQAMFSLNSYYSLNQSDFAFHTASLNLVHYQELHQRIVLATRLRSAFSFGPESQKQQFYMGGLDDWITSVFFENGIRRPLRSSTLNSGLYPFHFQEFLTPMHGFLFSTREGTKYVLANFEVRFPISRMARRTLQSGGLYNLEIIPFFDAGTVWRRGNPFSQKNPTDTQIVGSPPITVQLQTLKSPFLFGFGTGFRVFLMGYSLRVDAGWGIDDNSLRAPVISTTLSKRF
ncbi:MAG: hypothetical protein D6730_04490 [Bacteroidetes bacterium]|nr:MAG: hypothetical protein D6730_04490 [Bacteroidota bacterium]